MTWALPPLSLEMTHSWKEPADAAGSAGASWTATIPVGADECATAGTADSRYDAARRAADAADGMRRRSPGFSRLGFFPMTARLASYSPGHSIRYRAAIPLRESPRRTTISAGGLAAAAR